MKPIQCSFILVFMKWNRFIIPTFRNIAWQGIDSIFLTIFCSLPWDGLRKGGGFISWRNQINMTLFVNFDKMILAFHVNLCWYYITSGLIGGISTFWKEGRKADRRPTCDWLEFKILSWTNSFCQFTHMIFNCSKWKCLDRNELVEFTHVCSFWTLNSLE